MARLAHLADSLGGGDLLEGSAGCSYGEEQIRISIPACRTYAPPIIFGSES